MDSLTTIISDLGFPIAIALSSLYAVSVLMSWITNNLEKLLIAKADETRQILITLINRQKEMEIKLSEWSSNTEALVKFIVDLETARNKKDKDDIVELLRKKLNGNLNGK